MQTNEMNKQQKETTYVAPEVMVEDLTIELAFLGIDDGSAGGFDDEDL